MRWWNDFVNWASSSDGSRIISGAILPFIAIVVAGVIAALIARSTGRRLLASYEREATSAAVTSIITSARKATTWSTLGHDERSFAEHLGDEATVRLRLLPAPGAGFAASWAEHEISAIKANSATFTFQAEQTFVDLRDRLIEWQAKPSRARKLFRYDLERWKVEDDNATATAGAPIGVGPTAEAPAVAEQTAVPVATTPPATRISPAAEAVVSAPSPAEPTSAGPTPAAPVEPAWRPADRSGVDTADAADAATTEDAPRPVDPAEEPAAEAAQPSTPPRSSVVSAPVVQPHRALAPASPGDIDDDTPSGTESEPAYSAPVSAGQVRRRTSPDAS